MLIIIGILFGAVSGIAIHFLTPHRATRGPALAPAIAATIAGAVWLGFTWLGLGDNGWIWPASIFIPIVVTWPVLALISRARVAHDGRERARLKIA